MRCLKILFLTFFIACLAKRGPKRYRPKRLELGDSIQVDPKKLGRNAELEEIEAEAQRAINEANVLIMNEATRQEHPMEIAKKYHLEYDPEQVPINTGNYIKFEKHKELLQPDVHTVNDKYHLYYDVNVKEEAQTRPTFSVEHHVKLPNAETPESALQKAIPLLEKIVNDLIIEDKEPEEQPSRNDFPCMIDGSWISKIGGVKLKLNTSDDGQVFVDVSNTEVPHLGALHGCAWYISGLVPSPRAGPFALAAVCSDQRRIATFLGQCKICGEVETIIGNWMFTGISRDCTDAMTAIEIKSDIWKKDHLLELRSDTMKTAKEN